MKKRLFSILLTIIMLIGMLSTGTMATEELKDVPITAVQVETNRAMPALLSDGTSASDAQPPLEEGIYQISTADHLMWFAKQVNTGPGTAYDAVLTADIDMTGVSNWTAIGGGSYNYTGTFDGGGHSIKNLQISATDMQFVGLFGKATGTMKDLTMDESCSVDIQITDAFASNIWVAGMICVTRAGAIIENCHNEADYTVDAVGATANSTITALAGGVLGQHSGSATGCTNSGGIKYTVTGSTDNTGTTFVGGVVSRNYDGEVTEAENNGNIVMHATGGEKALNVYTGGVVGYGDSSGTLMDSINNGEINTNGANASSSQRLTTYTGGVAGYSTCETQRCTNKGMVETSLKDGSQSAYTGGVFGYAGANAFENCVNAAEVNFTADGVGAGNLLVSLYVGGIAGRYNGALMANCENESDGVITAAAENCNMTTSLYVGGLVGYQHDGMIKASENHAKIFAEGTKGASTLSVYASGMSGFMDAASTEKCDNDGAVSMKVNGYGYMGGITGFSESSNIIDCDNDADVYGESLTKGSSRIYAGGISGHHYTADAYDTIIEDCHNAGSVTIKNAGSGYGGGIAGDNYSFRPESYDAVILNCQNDGDVTEIGCSGARFGGITGESNSKIYNSRNSGNVTCASGSSYCGGLAGQMEGNAEAVNCYSTGNILNTSDSARAHLLTPLNQGIGVSYCYAFDTTNTALTGNKFVCCDTFDAKEKVAYNGETEEIDLLIALNTKAEEYIDDMNEWRSWNAKDGVNDGFPVLGTFFAGIVQEAEYQIEADGTWFKSSFHKALREVYDGGTVRILTDIVLNEPLVLTQNVTLTSADTNAPKMITSTVDGHQALLRLRSGKLVLKDIILDGGYKSDGSGITAKEALITVTGYCTLYIENGTEIRNNYNTVSVSSNISNQSAGGINAFERCIIIMNGGKIHHNYHCIGGGVLLNNKASFTLQGGVIHNNTAYKHSSSGKGYGGGVYIYNGTFTMKSGSIEKNTAASLGGGIYQQQALLSDGAAVNNSFVYLLGGMITENHADAGGGMAISGNPTWQWNGRGTWGSTALENVKITGNTANSRAGGVDINPGNVMHLSGYVYIADNETVADSNLSDVVLRNTADRIDEAGIIVIEESLDDNTKIRVDSFFKKAQISEEKILVARGTGTYKLTFSDFEKFICTNPDYALYLDANDNCIYLSAVARVSYDLNGGTGADGVNYDDVIIGRGAVIPAKEAPSKTGYAFTGWFDGTDTYQPEDDFAVDGDITLTAQWRELPRYIVNYDLNGGIGADGVDYTEAEIFAGTKLAVKAAPIKAGYGFTGWSDGKDIYQPGDEITVDCNLTLTAQWEEIPKYEVIYDLNGGDGAEGVNYAGVKVEAGTKLIVKEAPKKAGHVFDGWLDGKDSYQPGDEITVNSNMTLIAQWKTIAENIEPPDDSDDTTMPPSGENSQGPTGGDDNAPDEDIVPDEDGTPEGDGEGGTPEGDDEDGTPEGDDESGTPEGDDEDGTPEGDGEGDTPEGDEDGADTGDHSLLTLWVVTALTALAALITSYFAWRRETEK